MFLSICFSIFPYFFGATWPIQGSERRADITSLLYVLRWWWPLPSSWRQPWNLAPEIQRFIYGWKARIHSLSAFIELLLLFIAHQPPFFPIVISHIHDSALLHWFGPQEFHDLKRFTGHDWSPGFNQEADGFTWFQHQNSQNLVSCWSPAKSLINFQ